MLFKTIVFICFSSFAIKESNYDPWLQLFFVKKYQKKSKPWTNVILIFGIILGCAVIAYSIPTWGSICGIITLAVTFLCRMNMNN